MESVRMQGSELGATPLGDARCRVRVWAPAAHRVEVVLDGRTEALAPVGRGYHAAVLDGVEPGARYRLRLDGGPERPDPASRSQPDGVHGASEVVDPGVFAWHDDAWHGVPL